MVYERQQSAKEDHIWNGKTEAPLGGRFGASRCSFSLGSWVAQKWIVGQARPLRQDLWAIIFEAVGIHYVEEL